MKTLIITASLILTLGSTSAFARDSHHGGHHYRGHYYGGHNYGGHNYGRHYGNRGRHYSGHRGGEYLIGGLILGSLISHSYNNYQRRQHTYTRDYSYQPRYASSRRVIRTTNSPVVSGRRLFKDIDGNCFERRQDGNGNELLEALPAEECAW